MEAAKGVKNVKIFRTGSTFLGSENTGPQVEDPPLPRAWVGKALHDPHNLARNLQIYILGNNF